MDISFNIDKSAVMNELGGRMGGEGGRGGAAETYETQEITGIAALACGTIQLNALQDEHVNSFNISLLAA
jgi:hypothetical protein